MASNFGSLHEFVVDTLCSKLSVPPSALSPDSWGLPLTGDHVGLSYVDLAYLLFELERSLGVRVCEEHLLGYGFNSVDGIVGALRSSSARKGEAGHC